MVAPKYWLNKLQTVKFEVLIILICSMVAYKTLIENRILNEEYPFLTVNESTNRLLIASDTIDTKLTVPNQIDNTITAQQLIFQLATAISSQNYLTFNSDITINNHTFQALSPSSLIDAFSNKTMIFFGDSTVFKFYVFIVWCLDHYLNNNITAGCQFENGLLNHQLHDWVKYTYPTQHNISDLTMEIPDLLLLHYDPHTLYYNSKVINSKLYVFEERWDRNHEELLDLYHSWTAYNPDIIFWNPFGLHLLHLSPLRTFQHNALEIIHKFHDHLMEIYNVARATNAIMIYRGTSPLCYCKDHFEYKQIRYEYQQELYYNNSKYNNSMDCIKRINNQQKRKYQQLSLSIPAKEYCKNWIFMNEGVIYQNKLMKDFVDNVDGDGIYFYDRYSIFHSDPSLCCEEARDTAHWMPSYGADAMYLANVMNLVTV